MQLRPYQQAAVTAVYDHLRDRDDNPAIVLPTGAGKSLVIAEICKDAVLQWGGRVLILAHVRELLEQTADKLQHICPEVKFGIYSAGLKRRDTAESVIIAGIQSIYQKAELLGHFDLLIIDESHLIPLDGDGMYRTFIDTAKTINPILRVIGLTATPFRLQSGPICVPPPEGVLNAVCYEAGVKELIRDGYLSPLRSKAGIKKPNLKNLHVRQGEFVAEEVEFAMNQDPLVYSACQEIVEYTRDRKSCLIFASSIAHGRKIAEVLQTVSEQECGFIDGETPTLFRSSAIDRFREGELKYLCNMNVLTTGFDAPNIDCVALLRPTLSPGLYCLDSQTEILTESGWKGMGQVQVGEPVAAFDTQNESISYLPVLATIERDTYANESFISLESPASSIRVTDLHRLVISTKRQSKWRFQTALQTLYRRNGVALPKAGYLPRSGAPLSDDELRFLGWAMTVGHLHPHTNAISISLPAHEPYVAEIQRVIQSCSLKHSLSLQQCKTRSGNSRTNIVWTISKGKLRNRNQHLYGLGGLTPWLSKDFSEKLLHTIDARQFEVLLEAILLGNKSRQLGPRWTHRSYRISTENPVFAERLQICAVTRGFRCNISRQNSKRNPRWIVHIKKGTHAWVAASYDSRTTWELEGHQKERVWCVENDLGTLITRRNGKVTILGNCQMIGRGLRLFPGKTDCLVLDFAGNVMRHGPIDQIRVPDPKRSAMSYVPIKECPECHSLIATGYTKCPDCGYEYPRPEPAAIEPRDPKHEETASEEGLISGQTSETVYEVRDVFYHIHTKKGADESSPKSMRVDYKIGFHRYKSEWICFEHVGFARRRAEEWWQARSDHAIPATAEEAVELANAGAISFAKSITVRTVAGEKFDRIVDYVLDEKPETLSFKDDFAAFSGEEIPF